MKISHSSLFLAIRFKFSIMCNGVNLQRGNVFILVFVIYIAIEIIVIMSSIIEILEILLSRSPTMYLGLRTAGSQRNCTFVVYRANVSLVDITVKLLFGINMIDNSNNET